MHRRALLATPLAAPLIAALPTQAQAQAAQIATEEFMVPSKDPGIEIFVRNKRPEGCAAFSPGPHPRCSCTARPTRPYRLRPAARRAVLDGLHRRPRLRCLVHGHPRLWPQHPPARDGAAAGGEHRRWSRGDDGGGRIGAVDGFIRQRRGLPRVDLLGWSWGTALMARYAADNPPWSSAWCSMRRNGCARARRRSVQARAARRLPQGDPGRGKERWLTGVPRGQESRG